MPPVQHNTQVLGYKVKIRNYTVVSLGMVGMDEGVGEVEKCSFAHTQNNTQREIPRTRSVSNPSS